MRESYQRKPSPARKVFREIADTMLIPVLEFNLGLILEYANPAALNLLKITDEQLTSDIHVDNLVIPEQHSLVHEGLERLRQGEEPSSISLRVINTNSVAIPSQVYADRITVESEVVGFVVYILDLSRRTVIEDKLLSRKELLEYMVEYNSFTGIIIVDDSYQFEYVNDKLLDILDRTRSEVIHHDFRDFLHPDSVEIVSQRYKKRQQGENVPAVYELKILRKNGESRDIRMNVGALRGRDGQVRTVAQLMDITEEIMSEQALSNSEHRYRSLVETIDSGLAVDNVESKLVLVNEALCRMIGYSPDELVGQPITKILHGWTDSVVNEKIKARKEGKIEQYEAELNHKSGGLVSVVVSASPLVDTNGEYMGSMAVFTDVSQVKKAEAEVHFLLDLLLHDIGNQLQLILAGGDFLQADASSDQIIRSKRYILDGALRCLELIQKVRRAEEAKSEPLVPTKIHTVVEAEAELLFKQRGVRVDISGISPKTVVFADQALSQLIWNLLENAVIHNKRPEHEKIVEVAGSNNGDNFILTVSDNGQGIPNGTKDELFNPSRRYGGVGLHLVRRLAEKYGGSAPSVRDRVPGDPTEGLSIDVRFQIAK